MDGTIVHSGVPSCGFPLRNPFSPILIIYYPKISHMAMCEGNNSLWRARTTEIHPTTFFESVFFTYINQNRLIFYHKRPYKKAKASKRERKSSRDWFTGRFEFSAIVYDPVLLGTYFSDHFRGRLRRLLVLFAVLRRTPRASPMTAILNNVVRYLCLTITQCADRKTRAREICENAQLFC